MTGRDLLEPRPQICSFLAKRRLRHRFMINKGGVRIAVTSLLDSLSGMTLACANTRIVFDYRRSQAGHGTALIAASWQVWATSHHRPPRTFHTWNLYSGCITCSPVQSGCTSRAIWLHKSNAVSAAKAQRRPKTTRGEHRNQGVHPRVAPDHLLSFSCQYTCIAEEMASFDRGDLRCKRCSPPGFRLQGSMRAAPTLPDLNRLDREALLKLLLAEHD